MTASGSGTTACGWCTASRPPSGKVKPLADAKEVAAWRRVPTQEMSLVWPGSQPRVPDSGAAYLDLVVEPRV